MIVADNRFKLDKWTGTGNAKRNANRDDASFGVQDKMLRSEHSLTRCTRSDRRNIRIGVRCTATVNIITLIGRRTIEPRRKLN